jgi:hypothetical protein
MNIKGVKLEGEKRDKLEKKIDQDNRKICKFFKESFGMKETYLGKKPRITTDEGDELQGWGEITSYLGKIPGGMECQVENVYVEVEPIDEEDFDLIAHVKTTFNFGGTEAGAGSDPDGEGDLKHRRTCEWEPGGEGL